MSRRKQSPRCQRPTRNDNNLTPKIMWSAILSLCVLSIIFHQADSSLPPPQSLASNTASSAKNALSADDLESQPQHKNDTSSLLAGEDHDWRQSLPLELRNEKGAPLHRIILESKYHGGAASDQMQSTKDVKKKVTVYLLGTSHVSRTSCQDAKLLMEHVRPDVLFVELCSQRVGLMLSPPAAMETKHPTQQSDKEATNSDNNLTPISLKSMQKGATLLSKIQADYAKKLNVTIGGEFQAAFQSAFSQQRAFWGKQYIKSRAMYDYGNLEGYNHQYANSFDSTTTTQHPRGDRPCAVILGDRPVRITILRAWESLRLFGKIRLLLALLWSSIKQPSEKELREWMDSILNDRTGKNDLLTKAMEELGQAFPTIKRVIIEERDEFMAAKLAQVADMLACLEDGVEGEDKVIVAVVGAGHCPGMIKQLTSKSSQQRDDGASESESDSRFCPEQVLPSLVETKKLKTSNNEDVYSLVTDVVQFDYAYAIENGAL